MKSARGDSFMRRHEYFWPPVAERRFIHRKSMPRSSSNTGGAIYHRLDQRPSAAGRGGGDDSIFLHSRARGMPISRYNRAARTSLGLDRRMPCLVHARWRNKTDSR